MAELLHQKHRAYMYDVVIVGGGPAGLSAALVLGRCRRRVLLCDAGSPRNARAQGLHGYLTRDGIPPLDLLRAGRAELKPYGIELREVRVSDIEIAPDGFTIRLADGGDVRARTVLIAGGVTDSLPDIPGLEDCYGISAHHCPYCDGWEEREKALAVIGHGASGSALALALKTWSDRVTLCPNGRARLQPAHRAQLAAHGIKVHEGRIAAVEHEGGRARFLALAGGDRISCDAIFLSTQQRPQCDVPKELGCTLTRHGLVKTDHLGQTRVPGLYVAGDASRDVQFVVVAAAEGAKAAVAINKALQARAGLAVT
jgi:thioredoxin reductase